MAKIKQNKILILQVWLIILLYLLIIFILLCISYILPPFRILAIVCLPPVLWGLNRTLTIYMNHLTTFFLVK